MRLQLLASLTICLVLACSGAPRGDLIMGREFLSLVMSASDHSLGSRSSTAATTPQDDDVVVTELPVTSTTTEEATTFPPEEVTSPEPSFVSRNPFLKATLQQQDDAIPSNTEPQNTPAAVARSQLHAEEPTASVEPFIKKGRQLIVSPESRVPLAAVSRSQFHADEPSSKVARHYAASERVAVRLAPAGAYTRLHYRHQFPAPIKAHEHTRKIYQYQQPEQNYETPEQNYEIPEKVYGEPEKVYGQREKVYGEQEKVYGEPERVYVEPSSAPTPVVMTTEAAQMKILEVSPTTANTKFGYVLDSQVPEKFYTEFSKPPVTTESGAGLKVFDRSLEAAPTAASRKFGYVVEGRECRRYRVEERTPDGFIVGEYGVVSLSGGEQLERGVRYTADLTATNPRLIYEALMRFLSL